MCRRAGHGAQTSSLVALACLFVAVSAAARAHAQPSLEDAERTLENAEFERALTQLQALADDESLAFGRDELARLLRLRAVAAAALGRDDEAREALRALSTLLSGGPPGPLPPPLAATYAEVRSTAVLELQVALTRESARLSRAMMTLFAPFKLNVAALGNMVPQLHVHHIARSPGDAAWPRPVWGFGAAEPYADDALGARVEALRAALAGG